MLPTDGDDDSNPSHTGQSSSLHTSLSWPRLPELLLTNSHDTPTQPVLYSSPLANNVYRRSSNASKNNDTDSSSEYVSDDDAASRQKTDRNDLNEKTGSTHEKADSQVDGGSADTLVEAALDQDEAKDRHVRFPDHVAESAALVQRMLSTRGYSDGTSSAKSSHRRADSSIDMQSENSGSVLASLMKLEAQRRQQPSTSSYRSKRKKVRFSHLSHPGDKFAY
ncbi:uncharacterized protein BYT42DRAFT_181359 [Radiomyces spectabilis]|uniref:uncharacterized protein n=1 Tax=Radiomyces spectabilis TaxID=64574 RepID=UPI00222105CB|nr:uncharacterized protein BYT42DRAFT_181359 [Radiomyces spectabilis]KAI8391088.1 hypothetical protein BYT42DRAFT_181359 [Radiomyces spectabilis]